MASKSIMQQGDPRCYLCGARVNLERHHVMAGPDRQHSEKHGLWVWLCHNCHLGPDGAQYNRETGDSLKRLAQIAFEAKHSHDEWMQIFRKNYL